MISLHFANYLKKFNLQIKFCSTRQIFYNTIQGLCTSGRVKFKGFNFKDIQGHIYRQIHKLNTEEKV
jgi:hypothetical protein